MKERTKDIFSIILIIASLFAIGLTLYVYFARNASLHMTIVSLLLWSLGILAGLISLDVKRNGWGIKPQNVDSQQSIFMAFGNFIFSIISIDFLLFQNVGVIVKMGALIGVIVFTRQGILFLKTKNKDTKM